MRLSGMSGFQMSAWRGMVMGTVMITAWALTSRSHRQDLAVLRTRSGMAIVTCQIFNSMLFCLGIAVAPAAVVLFGVAAVPVFAAFLAWLIIGEPTHRTTWAAMVAVLLGIGIAVSGESEGQVVDHTALLGALFGLGVALVLALNFVILRARPAVPIPLAIGCGAWIAGLIGLAIVGPQEAAKGHFWFMMITGGIVLPVSFLCCLSLASRYNACGQCQPADAARNRAGAALGLARRRGGALGPHAHRRRHRRGQSGDLSDDRRAPDEIRPHLLTPPKNDNIRRKAANAGPRPMVP